MTLSLRIVAMVLSLCLVVTVLYIVRKGRISIKYSIIWLLSALIIFLVSLVPSLLGAISGFLGFQVASNLFLLIMLAVLFFISLSLTVIVTGQKEKIRMLIQEISIMKQELDKRKVN